MLNSILGPAYIFTLLLFSAPSYAQDTSLEETVLEAGDKVSDTLNKTAEKIDLTLAGKEYTNKRNGSSADINQIVTWSEGGVLKSSPDFSLNLKLPNLEKRWQLRFTSYDQDQDSHDLSQQRVRTRPRERNYGAGLFFFEQLGSVKTSFIPRLQLKNPLDMSYILRFEREVKFRSVQIRPRFDLFADPKKGTGEFASLEFHADLTAHLDVAQPNSEEYDEKGNIFSTQHGLSFDYSLTPTQAIGTGATTSSSSRERYHLDNLTANIVYGQQIYPERLRYSLSPFLSFSKADHFKGKAGLTFNMDLTF